MWIKVTCSCKKERPDGNAVTVITPDTHMTIAHTVGIVHGASQGVEVAQRTVTDTDLQFKQVHCIRYFEERVK